MKKEGYEKRFRSSLNKMLSITLAKNSDYAPTENALSNFYMVETLGLTTAENWILVRMSDKLSRIANLLKNDAKNNVKNESIEDTLIDLANYAIILKILIEDKKWIKEEDESLPVGNK